METLLATSADAQRLRLGLILRRDAEVAADPAPRPAFGLRLIKMTEVGSVVSTDPASANYARNGDCERTGPDGAPLDLSPWGPTKQAPAHAAGAGSILLDNVSVLMVSVERGEPDD